MTITTLTALIAATTTAGLGLVANVQDKGTVTPGPSTKIEGTCGKHGMMGRFTEKIGLTDGQKEQVRSLKEEARKALDALKNDNSLDRAAKTEKLKKIFDGQRERFQNILTDEQKAEIQKLKAEAMARKEERKAAFEKELGLTEAQRNELAKVRAEMQAKIGELRAKGEVTREQWKSEFESLRSRMDAVFTAEQKAKLESMKKQRHRGTFGGKRGQFGGQGTISI